MVTLDEVNRIVYERNLIKKGRLLIISLTKFYKYKNGNWVDGILKPLSDKETLEYLRDTFDHMGMKDISLYAENRLKELKKDGSI